MKESMIFYVIWNYIFLITSILFAVLGTVSSIAMIVYITKRIVKKYKQNKIPIWWYAGFQKGFFHGCIGFVKCWFISYSNPLWTIRDTLKIKRR